MEKILLMRDSNEKVYSINMSEESKRNTLIRNDTYHEFYREEGETTTHYACSGIFFKPLDENLYFLIDKITTKKKV